MWIRLVGFHLIIPVLGRLGALQVAVNTSLAEPRQLGLVGLGDGINVRPIRVGGHCHNSDWQLVAEYARSNDELNIWPHDSLCQTRDLNGAVGGRSHALAVSH